MTPDSEGALPARIQDWIDRAADWPSERAGVVIEASGNTLVAGGLDLCIGDLCQVMRARLPPLKAEVVGVQMRNAVLMPFGELQGVESGALLHRLGVRGDVAVSPLLVGRVIDGFGQPLDGRPAPAPVASVPLRRPPPPALQRRPIDQVVQTGVRVIDTLATLGEGQRVGVFAPAGAGKTTLLGMMARHARFDVNVIALVGERGRELGEFIHHTLGPEGLARSVVVVSTSDASAMERAKAAERATAIAEYFRDALGLRVLLLMDSVTRYARALREIGLAAGEPPARRGYPASVFAELPRLLERAGNSETGSITAIYTVLLEDDESADPIGEEIRSILDGHITLSRQVGARGRYPAVDVGDSLSRLMRQLVGPEHRALADRARSALARFEQVELLLQVGEYQHGSDAATDQAIAVHDRLQEFLSQSIDQSCPMQAAVEDLQRLLG